MNRLRLLPWLLCLLGLTACDRGAPPTAPAPAQAPDTAAAPAGDTASAAGATARATGQTGTQAGEIATSNGEAGQPVLIEVHPGQSPRPPASALREGERVLRSDPLFPDVDPADDPQGLANIHRIVIAGVDPATSPWDLAYRLREEGGFVAVEPDIEDALADQTERAAAACLGDDGVDAPTDPAWSLLEMNVPAARARALPPGGRALGEGVRICHPDTGWSHHVDLDRQQYDLASALDLVDGDRDAFDPLGYDGHPGHGTATGSLILSAGGFGAAGGTTGPGIVVGIAPKATVVPIRAFKNVVHVFDSDIAKAIRHAVDARCDVVSMSLGGRAFFGLERAIRDAVARDLIVVAAAGNCVGTVVAPALYSESVAVAATNAEQQPWRGSSRGRAVDISAPGEDVFVARAAATGTESAPHGLVEPGDGTSFATAATAAAAAVWIAFHGEAAIREAQGVGTRRDLFVAALRASARTPDDWDGGRYGAGILDLDALLAYDLDSPRTVPRLPGNGVVALIARMFDREPAAVRAALAGLLDQPADLDATLDTVGPELQELAVRDPERFLAMLDAAAEPGGGPRTARRVVARTALAPRASATLSALIDPSDPSDPQ